MPRKWPALDHDAVLGDKEGTDKEFANDSGQIIEAVAVDVGLDAETFPSSPSVVFLLMCAFADMVIDDYVVCRTEAASLLVLAVVQEIESDASGRFRMCSLQQGSCD